MTDMSVTDVADQVLTDADKAIADQGGPEVLQATVISSLIRRFREHAPAPASERQQVVAHDKLWWLQAGARPSENNQGEAKSGTATISDQPHFSTNVTNERESFESFESQKLPGDIKHIGSEAEENSDGVVGDLSMHNINLPTPPMGSSMFKLSIPLMGSSMSPVPTVTNSADLSVTFFTNTVQSSVDTAVSSSAELDLDRYTAKLLKKCEGLLREYKGVSDSDSDDGALDCDEDKHHCGSESQDGNEQHRDSLTGSITSSLGFDVGASNEIVQLTHHVTSTRRGSIGVESSEQLEKTSVDSLIHPNAKEYSSSRQLGAQSDEPQSSEVINRKDEGIDAEESSPRRIVPRPFMKMLQSERTEFDLSEQVPMQFGTAAAAVTVELPLANPWNASEAEPAENDSVQSVFMYLSPTSSVNSTIQGIESVPQKSQQGGNDQTNHAYEKSVEQQNLLADDRNVVDEKHVLPYLSDEVVQYLWARLQEVRRIRTSKEQT